MDGGVDPRQLTRQLSGFWRDALVGRARQKPISEPAVAKCRADQIVPVLHALLGVESATRRSDSPRWALETAIADATRDLLRGTPDTIKQRTQSNLISMGRLTQGHLDRLAKLRPVTTGWRLSAGCNRRLATLRRTSVWKPCGSI